ncbi:MAG: HepT-like ribonuclease domain-containing protein [Thermomicrobiales bacterium]
MDAAERIERFVTSRSYDEFLQDEIVRDAILYRLATIGEAAAHVSQPLRRRYPDVEWSDIVAFRNFAIHAYFAVDWSIVWKAATQNALVVCQG